MKFIQAKFLKGKSGVCLKQLVLDNEKLLPGTRRKMTNENDDKLLTKETDATPTVQLKLSNFPSNSILACPTFTLEEGPNFRNHFDGFQSAQRGQNPKLQNNPISKPKILNKEKPKQIGQSGQLISCGNGVGVRELVNILSEKWIMILI